MFETKDVIAKKIEVGEDILIRYFEALNSLSTLIYAIQTKTNLENAILDFKTKFLILILATENYIKKEKGEDIDWFIVVSRVTDPLKLIEYFRDYKEILVKSKILEIRKLGVESNFAFMD